MKNKNNIKKHEEEYIHIRKIKLLPLFLSFLFLFLSIGNFMLMYKGVIKYSLNCSDDCSKVVFQDLQVIPIAILEYILISLFFISIVALIKGGYDKLDSYSEGVGLISGLIYGLILGLIYGLILGLIAGLILGLIAGLFAGLIAGLILGLISEFNRRFNLRFNLRFNRRGNR